MLMVNIAHLTNSGKALDMNSPYLSGGHPHQGIATFFSHKLGPATGAPHKLPPFATVKLNIVYRRACRDRF
jgi:hypothetical protein